MIELKLLVDEVDYDSLAETLLPLVQDKLRDSGGMLGGMLSGSPEMAAAMARRALRAMSQEKKDELLVQLVTKNRGTLLQKGGELAEKNGIKLHLYDVSARKIPENIRKSTGVVVNTPLKLKNRLKDARTEVGFSQSQLAEMVGVSRNTISSIETGQFNPTAKLALILCIALDKKFEELFYF